jgi:hypothetical protein
MELARSLPRGGGIVNMSGRGDKDLFITARELTPEPWRAVSPLRGAAIDAAGIDAAGIAATGDAAISEGGAR